MRRLFLKLKLGKWPSPALLALGLGLSGVTGLSAQAADNEVGAVPDTATPAPASAPPVIEQLRASGLEVKGTGIIGGELRFWRVRSSNGREALIATTPGGLLVRGKIYTPDGALTLDTEGHPPLSLSQDDRRKQGLSRLTGLPPTAETDLMWRAPNGPGGSKSMTSGTVWDQLGQATAIEEGKAGAPLVYIFFDPYCSYCHQQWQAVRGKVQQGKLRVRWVPVAVLSGSQGNLGVVGGLLDDADAEILAGWMRHRQVQPNNSEAAKKALGLNMALFQALKAPSVPALIYKDKNGKLIMKVGVTDL
jgi:thiol:disulfide interchange protein DsbG